jgi:tetratricopeptide (TPR) repeat protein
MIATWVLPYKSEQDALGPRHDFALDRATSDSSFQLGQTRLIDYLDFQDSFTTLNRNSAMLPVELRMPVRDATPSLDQFVAVRNRVMHGRPLHPDDLDLGVRLCLTLTDTPLPWPKTEAIVKHISEDATWSPIYSPSKASGVLHKLPLPDFDETGLLGRVDDSRKLRRLLLDQRERVITVVGEGGIGKTALTVNVLYDLVELATCPYEALLWASLKTEMLTARGVEEIAASARDLMGITRALASSLDPTYEGSIEELADVLEGTETLIVIDNLETADANDFIRLYDALPRNVYYLLTSRVGLGELERRVPVGPLAPEAAEAMLRRLGARRGVDYLARLSKARAKKYIDKLRHSPLAIRWFVEAVEAGADPDEVVSDQRTLLEFSMSTIYNTLTDDARRLVATLFAYEGSSSVNELALISELPTDDLRRALQALQRRSLVVAEPSLSGDYQAYSLAAAAREYLRIFDQPHDIDVKAVRERVNLLRRSEERRRRDEARNFLAPHSVSVTSDADLPVAHLLRHALSKAKQRDYDEAREAVRQARELSPEFFEVPRVEAFLESREHPAHAEELYREAYRLAPEEFRPKVAYYLAAHLSNILHQPEDALAFAEEAHRALESYNTFLRLGQIHMYLERYGEAAELLNAAVDMAPDEKGHRIALTIATDLAKRRVEELTREANADEAISVGQIALRRILAAQSASVLDHHLDETWLELATEMLRTLIRAEHELLETASVQEFLCQVEESAELLATFSKVRYWNRHSAALAAREDIPPHVSETLLRIQDRAGALAREVNESGRKRGRIFSYSATDHYGFIECEDSDDRFFFPDAEIAHFKDAILLVPGAHVSFTPSEDSRGQRARDVTVSIDPRTSERVLTRRSLVVEHTARDFAIARDEITGVGVYVPRRALAKPRDWPALAVGDRCEADLEPGVPRARAVESSLTRGARPAASVVTPTAPRAQETNSAPNAA